MPVDAVLFVGAVGLLSGPEELGPGDEFFGGTNLSVRSRVVRDKPVMPLSVSSIPPACRLVLTGSDAGERGERGGVFPLSNALPKSFSKSSKPTLSLGEVSKSLSMVPPEAIVNRDSWCISCQADLKMSRAVRSKN